MENIPTIRSLSSSLVLLFELSLITELYGPPSRRRPVCVSLIRWSANMVFIAQTVMRTTGDLLKFCLSLAETATSICLLIRGYWRCSSFAGMVRN